MSQKWCFLSDDAPFYVGSQRICHIPRNWRGDGHEEPDETFVVWKNGNQTDECTLFLDEVQRICALDAAPSRRGGSLRSIFSRKDPVTREAFLNPEKSE